MEIKHTKSIKMALLIEIIERGFLFISGDLLCIKVTPANSQSQVYFKQNPPASLPGGHLAALFYLHIIKIFLKFGMRHFLHYTIRSGLVLQTLTFTQEMPLF